MNIQTIASSADPEKVSLTVRGLLVAIVPLTIAVTGLSADEINPLVDSLVQIVFLATSLYSAIAVVYGAIRKLYLRRWGSGV